MMEVHGLNMANFPRLPRTIMVTWSLRPPTTVIIVSTISQTLKSYPSPPTMEELPRLDPTQIQKAEAERKKDEEEEESNRQI
jgi:hypothetical protein